MRKQKSVADILKNASPKQLKLWEKNRTTFSTFIPRNRPEVIASYRSMPYSEYLQTEWWKKFKKAAIIRAKFKCQQCGCSKPLDVHHLTYERVGTEADADVKALCRPCHTLTHFPPYPYIKV